MRAGTARAQRCSWLYIPLLHAAAAFDVFGNPLMAPPLYVVHHRRILQGAAGMNCELDMLALGLPLLNSAA